MMFLYKLGIIIMLISAHVECTNDGCTSILVYILLEFTN